MTNQIAVLCAQGDIKIEWDPEDPQQTQEARQAVLDLQAKGYVFFLTDGQVADAVTAGQGTLNCRPVTVAELLPEPGSAPDFTPTPEERVALSANKMEAATQPVPPKRGRRTNAQLAEEAAAAPASPPETSPVRAVAMPALRGG